jgi:uncharacterized membrane protein YfcA
LSAAELALLVGGGFVAGVINTLAGGGSLITVPLLVVLGLPGTIANATNRVGVFLQSIVGAWRFRVEGVSGFGDAGKLVGPLLAGAAVGAVVVSELDDRTFERLFAVIMLAMLIPMLRGASTALPVERAMSPAFRALTFFGIGLYGGAIQAGVGIFLIFALSRVGHDLVRANSIKVVLVAAFTSVAVAVFVVRDQVVWYPALALAASNSAGAAVGARIAVRGGERVIRPVLVVCVVALAGRMLGLN